MKKHRKTYFKVIAGILLIGFLLACFYFPGCSLLAIIIYAGLFACGMIYFKTDELVFDELDADRKVDLIREIIAQNMESWNTTFPGLIGAGAGKKTEKGKKTGKTALIFTVTEKITDPNAARIPASILYKGYTIPTDVIVTGKVASHHVLGFDLQRDGSNYTGAAGLKVFSGGQPCILSCYHVLYPNELISRIDNGVPHGSPFVHKGGARIGRVLRGLFSILSDSAIMSYDDADGMELMKANEINKLKGSDLETEMRISISRNGAVKSGFVQHLGHSCSITFLHSRTVVMYDLILTTNFTNEGDSGSVAYDDNGKLVGMVIGGDTQSASYLLPITRVLNSMDVTLT